MLFHSPATKIKLCLVYLIIIYSTYFLVFLTDEAFDQAEILNCCMLMFISDDFNVIQFF